MRSMLLVMALALGACGEREAAVPTPAAEPASGGLVSTQGTLPAAVVETTPVTEEAGADRPVATEPASGVPSQPGPAGP